MSSFVTALDASAVNVAVNALDAVCFTSDNTASLASTVTFVDAVSFFVPTVAVTLISAVPAVTPVTTPLLFTVATAVSELS